MDTPDLLTRLEAAAYLGIAPRTLDYWRAAGKLPEDTEIRHVTTRKSVRFRQAKLAQLKADWIAVDHSGE